MELMFYRAASLKVLVIFLLEFKVAAALDEQSLAVRQEPQMLVLDSNSSSSSHLSHSKNLCLNSVQDLISACLQSPVSKPCQSLVDKQWRRLQVQYLLLFTIKETDSEPNHSKTTATDAGGLITSANQSVGSHHCCSFDKNTKCHAVMVVRKRFVNWLPPSLMLYLGVPLSAFINGKHWHGMDEHYCWTMPEFCPNLDSSDIIEFIHKLATGELTDLSATREHDDLGPRRAFTIQKSNHTQRYSLSIWNFCEFSFLVYTAFAISFLASLPIAVWVAVKFATGNIFLTVPMNHLAPPATGSGGGRLKEASTTIRQVQCTISVAIVVHCWLLVIVLYASHYYIQHTYRAHHLKVDAVPELYLQCSRSGFVMLFVIGSIALVEFPFLVYLLDKRTTKLNSTSASSFDHNHKPGITNRRRRARNLSGRIVFALALSGIVYCIQTLAGYLMYYLLCLVNAPAFAIANCSAFLTISTFIVFAIATSIHCCANRCKAKCKGYAVFIFALLVSILLMWISSMFQTQSTDKEGYGATSESFNSTKIISGLFASGLLSIIGYFAKTTFLKKTSAQIPISNRMDCEDGEMEPLLENPPKTIYS